MAGKRLLDAAKLFNVGRSIARQHLALRQQQWDDFNRTSSLAQSVKSQTDRVTVTAGAAYELAKRFAEDTPAWRQGADEIRERNDYGTGDGKREQASERDNASSVVDSAVKASPDHAKRSHEQAEAADEPVDDGTLASLRSREPRRYAERITPSETADSEVLSADGSGHDTFNVRSGHTSPPPSSYPREILPQNVGNQYGTDPRPADPALNQDVYYTPNMTQSDSARGHSSDTELANGMNPNIFSNPKVSRMLRQDRSSSFQNPYGDREKLPPQPLPEMVKAAEQRKSLLRAPDTISSSGESADVEELAHSISHEVQQQSVSEAGPSGLSDQKQQRPFQMKESRVPASRFGRLWQYSGLATSMAFGAVGEGLRRVVGGGDGGSLMLSEANMNRLVVKLSRMRGAALKLGQMMSFQDSKLLPPAIHHVLQRVQDSADYMPASQRNKVLSQNLGEKWRDLFSKFEEKPFAAASIGQVHRATLASNGKDVAVKVQYPGVKNSIDSDLNNLSLLLTASKLLPRGLFLEKTIANARMELAWECDYDREAEACIRFHGILAKERDVFTVPVVYKEASGSGVLTAEFMSGQAVTKIRDLSSQERDWLGTQILRLCLRELMEWRFMQTDPNWTNFLYNRETEKLELLDFGASRDFPDKFVVPYVNLLIAASRGDRDACRDLSIELGYLTGRETPAMLAAHVDSILTLAEPFVNTAPEVYNFEGQTITDRVTANIGLMLKERLAPPPEETYSLHRKLSGAFLLCARLGSRVRARELFDRAVQVWQGKQKDALEKSKL